MEQKQAILMAQIEAKYNEKIKRAIRRYNDRTMEELWKALDKLKAKMRQEMEDAGLNVVENVDNPNKILTTDDFEIKGQE